MPIIFLTFIIFTLLVQIWLFLRQLHFINEIEKDPLKRNYTISKTEFQLTKIVISWLVMLFWTYGAGVSLLLDHLSLMSLILQESLVISIVMLAAFFINQCCEYYRVFCIEQRFQLNRTTKCLFFIDLLKGFILLVSTMIILIPLTVFVTQAATQYDWLVLWFLLTILIVCVQLAYQTFIIKWFNTFYHVKKPSLQAALAKFAIRYHINPEHIYVINASKRSNHSNAYISGFGRFKKIVLFDTLLQKFSDEEIISILAHEIGHSKHLHEVKRILGVSVMLFVILFMLNHLIDMSWLGIDYRFSPLVGFIVLWPLLKFLMMPWVSQITQNYELQADYFAAKSANPKDLQDALEKLGASNHTSSQSDQWYAFVYQTHPSVATRIKQLALLC